MQAAAVRATVMKNNGHVCSETCKIKRQGFHCS